MGFVHSYFYIVRLENIFKWHVRIISQIIPWFIPQIVFVTWSKYLIECIDSFILIRWAYQFNEEYCSIFRTNKSVFSNICNEIGIGYTLIECACRLNFVFDKDFILVKLFVYRVETQPLSSWTIPYSTGIVYESYDMNENISEVRVRRAPGIKYLKLSGHAANLAPVSTELFTPYFHQFLQNTFDSYSLSFRMLMFQAFISIFKFLIFFHVLKKLFFLFATLAIFPDVMCISSSFIILVLHNFEMAILRIFCRWSSGISDSDMLNSTYPKNLHLNFLSIWFTFWPRYYFRIHKMYSLLLIWDNLSQI